MAAEQLISRIRQAQSITPSERRLADFITRNPSQAVFENVTTLADKTGVSKATVVRFIAKLGYDGFGALRRELQEDARVMFESPPPGATASKSGSSKPPGRTSSSRTSPASSPTSSTPSTPSTATPSTGQPR
jgi:DNA-binding MurR/RpiR family transcriptional regulator